MEGFGIHPYHQTAQAKADLVLVHGLMGDSRGTWTAEGGQGQVIYWPDWVKARRPDVNIWCVDYETSVLAWAKTVMPLETIGGALLLHARDQGLGTRPIHWLGHSMGGLIIKHVLCQARRKANAKWHGLSNATRAITFLGTPHHGSDLAKWGDYFANFLIALDLAYTGGITTAATGLLKRASDALGMGERPSQVRQLRKHGKELGDLNDEFAQWLGAADQQRDLWVRNYYETLPVMNLVTVVPEHSARLANALVDEAGDPRDHFGICKFRTPNDVVFTGILKSFDEITRVTSPSGKGMVVDAGMIEGGSLASADVEPSAATGGPVDLTDLAWRGALKACSPASKTLASRHLATMLGSEATNPDDLEHAIAKAFEGAAYERVGNLRTVLRETTRSLPSSTESHELVRLYWMLLVRAAALACSPAVCGVDPNDFRVPDELNRLAITIAAHLIFGQGVELTFGPAGVQVENLIDLAALPDSPAQDPAQASEYSGLRQEILDWVGRVRGGTHTPGTTQMLKGAMDGRAARPLLLDRQGELASRSLRELARELGIGIVCIESDGRPSSIAPHDWRDLCQAIRIELEYFAGQPTSASAPPSSAGPAVALAGGAQLQSSSPIQVSLHQTFAAPVGQSNVTTGDCSAIHARHNDSASPVEARDELALSFVGFEVTLGDDARLKADLHELRDLVVRKDATQSAMGLLVRLLPPLRGAAARPGSGQAWERLRHAVHEHWPEVKPLI